MGLKRIIVGLFLFSIGLSLYAEKKEVSIADGTFNTAAYTESTKTLTFTGNAYSSAVNLSLKGDLSAYKSLVFSIGNSNTTISIAISYIDAKGAAKTKTYYQASVTSSTDKVIDLTDTTNISLRTNITSIVIASTVGNGTYVTFNSVYLSLIDVGGTISALNTISVDTSKVYQTVTGFGGMNLLPTWSTYLSTSEVDLVYGKATGQLGYNIMRVRVHPDGATKWADMVASMKRAKTYGAIIFATPWTPPVSMKSNGALKSGYLLESSYADYAAYLKSFVTYMANQGVAIDAISVQNEPDCSTTNESCVWTPTQITNFVKNYGNKLGTKCLAAEAIGFNRSFTDSILNNSTAVNNVDYIGGHLYGGTISRYDLAKNNGKEVWMTEHLLGSDSLRIPTWSEDLAVAKEVNDCMLADYNAYVWWYVKRFYSMIGDGTYGTTNGVVSKRGYIMSLFAKNITGATRVDAHSTDIYGDEFFVSAYKAGRKFVVMVINQSLKTFSNVAFSLPFTPASVQGTTISPTENMVTHNVTLAANQNPVTTIAPQTVSTFIFTADTTAYNYNFNADTLGTLNLPNYVFIPSGNGATAGVVSYSGTDNGVIKISNVFKPATSGSINATGVADLDLFPSTADYSVTWKEYFTTATKKKGFLLRGSGSCGYSTGMKQGYYFMVNQTTTTAMTMKIYLADSKTLTSKAASASISGIATGKACWFRATVQGSTLSFEYSQDSLTWTTGVTYTDATYSSGTTQCVWGLGSGTPDYYFDDISFKNNSTKQRSAIMVTGTNLFPYSGAAQGPASATVIGSTGSITYSYSGTGSTVYATSSTKPSAIGTYQVIATVASDANFDAANSNPFGFSITTTTDVYDESGDNINLYVESGNLIVIGIQKYSVYNIQGVKVADVSSNNSSKTTFLLPGVYMVKVGAKVKKVIVK